jgi:hypothetical protein
MLYSRSLGRAPEQRSTLYGQATSEQRASSQNAAALAPVVWTPPRKRVAAEQHLGDAQKQPSHSRRSVMPGREPGIPATCDPTAEHQRRFQSCIEAPFSVPAPPFKFPGMSPRFPFRASTGDGYSPGAAWVSASGATAWERRLDRLSVRRAGSRHRDSGRACRRS